MKYNSEIKLTSPSLKKYKNFVHQKLHFLHPLISLPVNHFPRFIIPSTFILALRVFNSSTPKNTPQTHTHTGTPSKKEGISHGSSKALCKSIPKLISSSAFHDTGAESLRDSIPSPSFPPQRLIHLKNSFSSSQARQRPLNCGLIALHTP